MYLYPIGSMGGIVSRS